MARPSRVPFWTLTAALIGGLASAFAPAPASAQTEVIVLGIRSLEGDDEFARNLTGALRNEAAQVRDWAISDREVTLAQLVLAHGCEEPDQACMTQIADSLQIDRILYGDVRRTEGGERSDFEVELHLFDGSTDQITQTVEDTIPQIRTDIDDLREPARRYVAALSGAPQLGTARIAVGVPDADVFVDGEAVGTTNGDGVLVIENLEAGNRSVRVEAEGYETYTASLAVEPYAEASLEGELRSGAGGGGGGGPSGRDVEIGVGIGLTAAGLILGGLWAGLGSYYYFDLAEQVPTYTDETALIQNTDDFCSDIDGTVRAELREGARDLCSEMEPYPYMLPVLGVSALVVGATGIYFLISGLTSGDDGAEQAGFRFEPSIGPNHVYFGGRLTF